MDVERDEVNVERDQVNVERDQMNVERDQVSVERDQLNVERGGGGYAMYAWYTGCPCGSRIVHGSSQLQ